MTTGTTEDGASEGADGKQTDPTVELSDALIRPKEELALLELAVMEAPNRGEGFADMLRWRLHDTRRKLEEAQERATERLQARRGKLGEEVDALAGEEDAGKGGTEPEPGGDGTEGSRPGTHVSSGRALRARDRLGEIHSKMRGLEGALQGRSRHLETDESEGLAFMVQDLRKEIDAVCELLADA